MLHPYNLSVAWARKYGFDESREHVLRALLAGAPIEVIQRFENRRRSTKTIAAHREAIEGALGWVDLKIFRWMVKRNARKWQDSVSQRIYERLS